MQRNKRSVFQGYFQIVRLGVLTGGTDYYGMASTKKTSQEKGSQIERYVLRKRETERTSG